MDLSLNQPKEGLSMESPQTRSSPRIPIQIPIFVRGFEADGPGFIELTKTLNISARGACITLSHPLRPNQVVQLTIPAPAPAASSLIPSETPPIMAKVRRIDTLGDMRIFGLEFLRPLE